MSTIIKSKSKICRKYGANLWGKSNNAYEKKPYKPGQHRGLRRGGSDYAKQVVRKQKVKFYYLLSEKSLRTIAKKAVASLKNSTEYVISHCESLSYVILYRAGVAPTMFFAKQLIGHGHTRVNGKKTDVPSHRLKVGDKIQLTDKAVKIPDIVASIASNTGSCPDYLTFSGSDNSITVNSLPKNESEVPYESQLAISSVVEYYSK